MAQKTTMYNDLQLSILLKSFKYYSILYEIYFWLPIHTSACDPL